MSLKKICLGLTILLFSSTIFASIDVIHPHYGHIQQSFTELARTRLEKFYEINMPLSGQIKRIEYQEGSRVKQGQIIAQLVQLPWVETAKETEAHFNKMTEQYNFQVKELDRFEKLKKKNFVTESEVDKIRMQVKTLKADIAKSKTQLEIAQYNLRLSTIYSPINGFVLKRYTQGGKWLQVGTPLLRLGDFNDLEVVSEVLTQDAQLLKVGDPVLLSSTGTTKILKGNVKKVEPEGFTKKSSLGVDEQRVNVITTIENPEKANVQVGYRLHAKFLVGDAHQNALLIPRFSVLQDNQGQHYVFKMIENKLKKQIIKINAKTDAQISVVEGLAVNDSIVAQPTAEMHDGMKV